MPRAKHGQTRLALGPRRQKAAVSDCRRAPVTQLWHPQSCNFCVARKKLRSDFLRSGACFRTFGFTNEGLVDCFTHSVRTAHFRTIPDPIAEKYAAALGDHFPFATAGLALWVVMRRYVCECPEIFYPPGSPRNAPDLRSFYQTLIAQLPNAGHLPLFANGQLIVSRPTPTASLHCG